MADDQLLEFRSITKEFGGTRALSEVSLDLKKGEILALLGENGAGKSTLIKTLAGIHKPDGGEIRFAARLIRIARRNRTSASRSPSSIRISASSNG